MRKSDLGLIAFSLKLGSQEAIQLKIYRDGTLIRVGAGGVPAIPIGAVSYWPENGIFPKLAEKIPPALLMNDIDYTEQDISQLLVYEMRLCGRTLNGMVGESALWSENLLIRFTLDLSTRFRSPVLAFIDSLLKDATGFTNNWYFDALILAIFGQRSNRLPKQTLIAKPEEEVDLKPELAVFLSQMLQSQRKWNFMLFPEGKVYENEQGERNKLIFQITDGQFSYHFQRI
jgi:hypothetical protein